ncbi:MAG: cell wall-binding repeat-containing protein [Clostridiales bacterium]|nr:cell wall-binding repeat-containing protein [Clostridiales bacterium]
MKDVRRRAAIALLCAAMAAPALPAEGARPIVTPDATSGLEQPAHGSGPSGGDAGRVVVLFSDGHISRGAFEDIASLGAASEDVTLRGQGMLLVTTPDGIDPGRFAARIAARRDVVAAAPDFELSALSPPNDPYYPAALLSNTGQRTYLGPTSIHPHAINIEPVWEAAFGTGVHSLAQERDGVTVAVIDSGVTPSLREETGEYVMVWDYVNADNLPLDDLGHGTRVASIIRAQSDNAFGIAGVLDASTNRILVYKTLGATGMGSVAWTIEAMLDASSRGARVINLSLGISPANSDFTAAQRDLLDAAVAACLARGSIVVAAAGNTGTRGVFYPAASPGALAVGAIEHTGGNAGKRWSSSSFGPELDLAAPGVSLWTAGADDQISQRSGTSHATPLVSGTAALIWSFMPGLSADEVADILVKTADGSVGSLPGFDVETGHGRIDAFAALHEVRSRISTMPALEARATLIGGFEYELSWSAPTGAAGVFYRYGSVPGPTYTTTQRSARLFVTRDGPNNLWVRAYASNRWPSETTTISVETASGSAPLASERLGGRNRYATAALVSTAGFSGPVESVVLASGVTWPDALAGGPLAYALGGPLLITRPDRLSVETRDALLRFSPRRVVIAGGSAALSPAVEAAIRSLLPSAQIERVAGKDRYETAALIAARVAAATGLPGRRVFVASGVAWPDALAASPAAAANGTPILLTRPDALPQTTRDALVGIGTERTMVIGGELAISRHVAAMLPAPTRVAGRDRYETAREVAGWAKVEGILGGTGLGIASGVNFVDALVAGPFLAGRREPLILGDRTDQAAAVWLQARDPSGLTLFGGPAALTIDAENALKRHVRGVTH